MAISLWPSVWGWYAKEKFNFVPKFSKISFQNLLVILRSLLETILLGRPWYLKMLEIKRVAIWCSLIVFLTDIKWACLLNQSTIIHMPVFPWLEWGNPKTKSMDILSHGPSRIGRGYNNSGCFPLLYFTFWHTIYKKKHKLLCLSSWWDNKSTSPLPWV